MLFVILFFAELLILFLLSRVLTQLLSVFFYSITKSRTATIYLLALLFFPGTVIHEFAHAMTAAFLGVQVSDMEFIPKLREDSVKLGSVAIAKTDPLRRLFIGMAPFLLGTLILLGVLFLADQSHFSQNRLFIILMGYGVFEIGNTMFSSRKDMEGALEVLLVIVIFIGAFYLLGFRLPAINPNIIFSNPQILSLMQKASTFLLVPLGIDLITIFLIRLLQKI